MKYLKRILLTVLVVVLILVSSFFIWVYCNQVTPILMYHHVTVSDQDEADKVNPDVFKKQMRLIKRFGYHVIGLDEFVNKVELGENIDRKSIVITFDDGYDNNYTHAFPVLKEYGYPAAVFVQVDKIGTPGYLNWEQIKEMDAAGIIIGSHTLSHPYLPDFDEDYQRREFEISKRRLEHALNKPVEFLAYPGGAFNEASKRAAKEAGYRAALTTNRGYDPKNEDLFELNRVRLSNSDTNELYTWVKFAGYSNVFREGKDPY